MQEVKKRFLQNNKLTPILIGISREGIIRVDPKTKEVNILHCDPLFQLSDPDTTLLKGFVHIQDFLALSLPRLFPSPVFDCLYQN